MVPLGDGSNIVLHKGSLQIWTFARQNQGGRGGARVRIRYSTRKGVSTVVVDAKRQRGITVR